MDAPPNRGSFNSAHIFGTHVPGGGAVHSIRSGSPIQHGRRLDKMMVKSPGVIVPMPGATSIVEFELVKDD
jgi:hypothetical protein